MFERQLSFPNPAIYRDLIFFPRAGDIVTRKTEQVDALEHFGMVFDIDWLGRIWIIECTKDIGVRVISFEDFNIKPEFKHVKVDDRERFEIKQRMQQAIQNKEKFQWSLLYNCEDFVNWLRTGKPLSVQRNDLLILSSLATLVYVGLKKL